MNTPPPTGPKESAASGRQPRPVENSKWLGRLEWVCVFTALFSFYLWYTKPMKTAAQSYFRLSLLIVGIVGYLLIQIVKWRRARGAASR